VLALPLVTSVGGLALSIGNLGIALVTAAPALAAFATAALPIAAVVLPIAAAVGGLAAAGYELYKHWDDVVRIFNEFSQSLDRVNDSSSFITRLIPGLNEVRAIAGTFGSDATEAGALTPEAKARAERFGNQSIQASRPSGATNTNNAAVEINFSRPPPGMSVRPAPNNTAPLSLSMGPALVTP
jgi:hypothetical protein